MDSDVPFLLFSSLFPEDNHQIIIVIDGSYSLFFTVLQNPILMNMLLVTR